MNKLTKKFDKNEKELIQANLLSNENALKVNQLESALKVSESYASQQIIEKQELNKQLNKLKNKIEKLKSEHELELKVLKNNIPTELSSHKGTSESEVDIDAIRTIAYKEGIKEGYDLGKIENNAMHEIESNDENKMIEKENDKLKYDKMVEEAYKEGYEDGVKSCKNNVNDLVVSEIDLVELNEQPSNSDQTGIDVGPHDDIDPKSDMSTTQSLQESMKEDAYNEGKLDGKTEMISLLKEAKEAFENDYSLLNNELEISQNKLEQSQEQVSELANRLRIPIERFMNGFGFDIDFVPKLVELGVCSLSCFQCICVLFLVYMYRII